MQEMGAIGLSHAQRSSSTRAGGYHAGAARAFTAPPTDLPHLLHPFRYPLNLFPEESDVTPKHDARDTENPGAVR